MEPLVRLVERSREGGLDAYGELVRRFQDMAAGYAYAILGDHHLAEDASQEAFVRAYLDLGQLRDPAAFPGWLRRIVFKQCDRIRRRRDLQVVSLEAIGDLGSAQQGADELLERRESRDRVTAGIRALPEHQRLAVSMFYIGELSLVQVATFLGTPVQTVKNRLHAARRRLKKELIGMARKKLQSKRPSRTTRYAVDIMVELAGVSDLGIQRVLRQVDQKDVVIALSTASAEVRDKILGAMSQRVRTYIEEEMEALGPVPAEEVRRAQQGMVDLLRQASYRGRKLTKEHQDRKRRLKRLLRHKPFGQMTLEDITGLFVDLARISSEEGPLALESFADAVPEGRADTDRDVLLFVSGLRRGIGGQGAAPISQLLEKRARLLIQEHETRCKIITEGLAALAERATPDYMESRLRSHYAVDSY
ncbi:sigma-70 family RNA polymerase sigma factor [Candidatus Latescibacterota bacterium]